MKIKRWTGILLSMTLALIVSGCGGDDYGQSQAQQDQERDQIIAKMESQLKQVDEQLDQIGDRLDGSGDAARIELHENHAKLEYERKALKEQMTELRQSSQNEWEQALEKAQETLDDLASRVDGMWNDMTQG